MGNFANDLAQAVGNVAQLPDSKAWPVLDALPRQTESQAEAFPLEALGSLMGGAATVIARDVQAPDALAAGAVLASCALAVQPLYNVALDGRIMPTSLFIATSCESGDRKSAVDNVALKPINDFVNHQTLEHSRMVAAIASDDKNAQRPVLRTLTTSQGTTQALQLALGEQSHIGVFSSEGAELLGGHSLTGEQKAAGFTWYLKAWGGERLDARTVKSGASSLLHRRVSMHLMVQPIILNSLLADPVARGNGFLARMLIAQPSSIAGTRIYSSANPFDAPEVERYNRAISDLLKTSPTVVENSDGYSLMPELIQFEAEARQMWVEFYNAVETEQVKNGKLNFVRGFASKAPEQAARIAGVIAAINGSDRIDLGTIEGAVRIAAWSCLDSTYTRFTRPLRSIQRC